MMLAGKLRTNQSALLCRIGNTPLVEITQVFQSEKIRIFAKCEWFNPGGSVKDRAAANIISEAEKSGELSSGKIILDATSGNTGIAFAMIGAMKGYRVELALPENASPERKSMLLSYGAKLHITSPLTGSDGAILKAGELVAEDPDRYFYADQYSNPANWQAHFNGTAKEIFDALEGEVTHFVAGIGTSGTFIGTSRGLKKRDSSIKVVSFIPESPLHGMEGLKHLPTAMVPSIYDPSVADQELLVETEDAYRMVRRLAMEEGLLVGPSAAGAVVAAIQVASNIDRGTIVTVFPDNGLKYLSEEFWRD
jgi:cysteine synthase B